MPKIDFQTVGYRLHPVTCLDDKIFHKILGVGTDIKLINVYLISFTAENVKKLQTMIK